MGLRAMDPAPAEVPPHGAYGGAREGTHEELLAEGHVA
jgi:hypothetical protein